MRAFWPVAVAGWIALTSLASALGADMIPWASDLQTAQQAAARSNRLVLIHFWKDACMPCRRLEANVFSQSFVAQAVGSKYVPVKINGEQQAALAARFGVDRFPMDVILTPSGQMIHAFVSPQDPNQYVAAMNTIHAQAMAQQAAAAPAVAQNNLPPRSNGFESDPSRASSWQPGGPPQGSAEPSRYGGGFAQTPPGGPSPEMGSRYGQPQPGAGAAPQTSIYGSPAPGAAMPPRQNFNDVGQRPADRQLGSSWPPAAAGQPFAPSAPGAAPQSGPPQGGPQAGMAPQGNSHPSFAGPANTAPENERSQVWEWSRGGNAPGAANPGAANPASQGVGAPPLANAQPPQAAPQVKPALDGYCPVTLVEQERWQKGDQRFGAIHRNRTYLFVSPAEQQKFLANPDGYSPVLSGFDPVRYLDQAELVEGKRKHGLFYDKRIYLFADEESLQKFWKSHPGYVQAVQETMTRNAAAPQFNR